MTTPCIFCEIVAGRAPATVEDRWDRRAIAIVPLDPVVPGHRLIIPTTHVRDAATDPGVTAETMRCAALYAQRVGPCNIITSLGKEATQSVFHLHVHIVPRTADDGLLLPWSAQQQKTKAPTPEYLIRTVEEM